MAGLNISTNMSTQYFDMNEEECKCPILQIGTNEEQSFNKHTMQFPKHFNCEFFIILEQFPILILKKIAEEHFVLRH